MFKVIELVLLGFGIISLYAAGMILTKEVQLLQDTRVDLDMQLSYMSQLTGARRHADIEVD